MYSSRTAEEVPVCPFWIVLGEPFVSSPSELTRKVSAKRRPHLDDRHRIRSIARDSQWQEKYGSLREQPGRDVIRVHYHMEHLWQAFKGS